MPLRVCPSCSRLHLPCPEVSALPCRDCITGLSRPAPDENLAAPHRPLAGRSGSAATVEGGSERRTGYANRSEALIGHGQELRRRSDRLCERSRVLRRDSQRLRGNG